MAAPFQILKIIQFQDVQKMQQNLVYNYFKNPHFYISLIYPLQQSPIRWRIEMNFVLPENTIFSFSRILKIIRLRFGEH
jgi:hypothetical protein